MNGPKKPNVTSISSRVSSDNSSWSLQAMLEHVALTHPDDSVAKALLILEFEGGSGHYYAVRADYKDMLWMIRSFERFLMGDEP